jgi:hypothetical protein
MDDERLGITTLARSENSFVRSMSAFAAGVPPFTPKVRTPPNPPLRYFFAFRCSGCVSRPG